MSIGSLRALVVATNFANLSVPAVVRRAEPEDPTPIATRVIWSTDETEDRPAGQDFGRRDRRRVLSVLKSAVPTIPLGSRITAPLPTEGALDEGWLVDGFDRYEPEHTRVVVIPDPDWIPEDEVT